MHAILAQGQRPARMGCDRSDHPRRPGSSFGRWARRFARDESGSVTVEYVIWLPFFFFLFLLIVDASFAFFAKAEAFRIIQSGNRLYSTNVLSDKLAVEAWVEAAYDPQSPGAKATMSLNSNRTIVSTQLVIPLREVVLVNVFNAPSSWNMTVRSQHYVEWPHS